MTWDIYALRGPGGARSIEALPEQWTPPPIGTPEEVVALLAAAVPEADVSDPLWVRVRGADWLVEVSLGKSYQVHDVYFYLTGDGAGPVEAVLRIARALGVTAYDTETGLILTPYARAPVAPPPGGDDDDERRPWWKFWAPKAD